MEKLSQDQKEKIVSILSNLSDVSADEITEDTKIKDGLGMDSLGLVEVIMELENEFDCNIPDEDYNSEITMTVGDIFEVIYNRIN